MKSLYSYWTMDWATLLCLAGVCVIYFGIGGKLSSRKSGFFIAGLLLILIAVASPLRFLGEHYLMSAHMLSHVLILLVAAPLLLLGVSANNSRRGLNYFSSLLIRFPWFSWACGVCIMWFWHIPAIFNLMTAAGDHGSWKTSEITVLQILHPISLLIAGILFSWPLIGPVTERRLTPLNAVLYLSSACVFCSLLGLLITFAPGGVYTGYTNPTDRFGFMEMIRNRNGISMLIDQQIAGLIMWVPGCLLYLTASMFLLMKWFNAKSKNSVFLTPYNGKHA